MQKHTEQANRLGRVVTQEQASGRVSRLAALVACASVLQVAETLLPYPLPGVRLGLANVFTLVALVETGPADAFHLALLRSLLSSFVLGTFLSPAFVLSFAGAVVSAAVMVLLFRMTATGSRLRFSF
ncbi:MAG: Gx transporter family protein, partial [candidate division WOR-3 bacterium]